MSDETIEVLLRQIADLQRQIKKLTESQPTKVFGMTDRMWERLAWVFVILLIIMLFDTADQVAAFLGDVINTYWGE